MILRSVELESFGKFRGQTVDFRRGLNLVIGPNEAGKSTLAEAIPAILFGTDRLERFKPWGRNTCSAVLFFEGHGRTIQIKRNLITDEVELVEKDDLYHVLSQFSGKVPLRGRSAPCREYRELLESLLGVADEDLFRATYFFGHQPKEWSGDELAQKLRTLVSGTAETDYAEILDSLLDEHFKLTRSNPWGRDKQRDREYEEVCQQLAEEGGANMAAAVPVFVEIDSSAEIKEQVDKLCAELEQDHQEYEKGLRYIERVRLQMAEPVEVAATEIVEKTIENHAKPVTHSSLSEQLVTVGLPPRPPIELPELLKEAADVRQEFAELQQPFSALGSREKQVPVVPWGMIAAGVALLGAGAAVAWWQMFQFPWAPLVAGVCAVALLSWGGWSHLQRNKALAECRKERSRLEQKKLAAQHRQAELSERCEGFGLPSSAVDLVRVQKLVTAHRELLDNYWQAVDGAAEQNSLSPEATEAGSQEATAQPRASEDITGAEHELRELEERLAAFEVELESKKSRLQELRQQLNESSNEQRPQTKTSGAGLSARKLELEERIAVLRKAINLLAGAVDEFSRSHLACLNVEASKLFGKITGGRYPALKLDENMTPKVQVDERRWMPVENFSRGTVDAIYLSLRVALAKVRDDGRSLPLMLDDPFVHLDQKRLATTLNLIDLASADGQMILFSHNLELGKRAARERWHVVPLDGDSVAANSDEGGEHAGQLHLL